MEETKMETTNSPYGYDTYALMITANGWRNRIWYALDIALLIPRLLILGRAWIGHTKQQAVLSLSLDSASTSDTFSLVDKPALDGKPE